MAHKSACSIKTLYGFFYFFLFGVFIIPTTVHAQELHNESQGIVSAKVISIETDQRVKVPGTEVFANYQKFRAEILEGDKKGKIVEVENDYAAAEVGETVFLNSIKTIDGNELYAFMEPDRRLFLYVLVGVFIASVCIFGGIQGVRGLLSLVVSLFFIIKVFLPAVLGGHSPFITSIAVASVIIVFGSYITHGFNRTTSSAVFGMIVTVVVTGFLAWWSVDTARLTGFDSEDAVYLNLNTHGNLDVIGLLLGGIMIGLLGVLYDVAIGQAISVEELHRAGPHLSRFHIYKRAIRMGREHIGALVNTLAIAYVGAALPLLLLFYLSDQSISYILNREVFATEIIRTLIGSIGLVLAVPITTLISVFYIIGRINLKDPQSQHRHSHGHNHSHST